MGVTVGDVDTLMPHTLCNSQGSKAHVDQQTDVAMSKLVEAENEGIFVEVENGT